MPRPSQQIARRLYGVLQVPSFDRMFSAHDNKLDMFDAMQSGSIVLVNTSKALLKTDASALFGRYMIARVIAAAFERIAIPAQQRNPAFLIVDEAAEYFDESLETLAVAGAQVQPRRGVRAPAPRPADAGTALVGRRQHLDQVRRRRLRQGCPGACVRHANRRPTSSPA